MNPVSEIIFAICWVILLVYTVRYSLMMLRVWNNDEMPGGYTIGNKKITKLPHPEMTDVKPGDELMVIKFDEPKKEMDPRFKLDSPELHNLGDPLHRSLQDRIDELNDDEDEDDEEGGLIVRS
tara:strand:+ start:226 stop:594 length:369 start_codon:yes stop_codon:yes gene_type:complete